MNPLVGQIAATTPFSPVKYVWFDFSDWLKVRDRYKSFFTNLPLTEVISSKDGAIETFPMPFDDLAFIISVKNEKDDKTVLIVMTVKRSDNILSISEWLSSYKDPVGTMTFYDHLYNDPMVDFNPEYVKFLGKQGVDLKKITERFSVLYKYMMPMFIALCMAKPEDAAPIEAYKCTENPANPKRIKRGKRPLFEWETVLIKPAVKEDSASLGGTHASPKPHDRRGHQRRCKNGKVVYVRPCTINKHKIKEEGFIHHDYKVVS